MNNDETIIIKITTVNESVKVSELTEREKIIHNHGYYEGLKAGKNFWPSIVVCLFGVVAFGWLLLHGG